MHLIQYSIANPVKVAVGVLLLALFGIVALTRMPIQLSPEVNVPQITIETRWRGASPQEIEREIVQEQEEFLKGVEGVTKMSSESMDSMGRIALEFVIGTNLSEALLKVESRLQQVPEYPENADKPVITTANSGDRPIAWFVLALRAPSADRIAEFRAANPELAPLLDPVTNAYKQDLVLYRLRTLAKEQPKIAELLPTEVDLTKLRRFCEDYLAPELKRVEGVAMVNVLGGQEEEMQVVVDPEQLAARHLTIDDLRMALRGQNQDTSGGDFWEGKRRYVVRTLGQFRSPEDVAECLVSMHDGAPVYVKDVAEVRLGYKKPDGMVRRFGGASIAMNAIRQTGHNVLEIMDGLRAATARLNGGILAQRGLEMKQVYDETEYIDSAIGLVNDNIVVGGILTVLCLLLFLRSGRSTLVIGLAIPVSIVGTFLILDLMGRSLNVISLAGLAFAVGMLVDNAVVVLENIYRHHQEGEPPFVAALNGAREVWGAVLSSTLTTLAVFIPVLFVEQEAGQLFRDIAIAISAAVGLSLIVSLTVIPCGAARILGPRKGAAGATGAAALCRRGPLHVLSRGLDSFGSGFVGAVVGLNRWLQARTWAQLATVVILAGAAITGSFVLMPPVEYLPNGNRNLVIGILLPPPGYNVDQMVEIGQKIETELAPYWEAEPGTPEAARLPFPPIADFFYVARGRQMFMGLRASDPMRAGELIPLVQKVAAGVPGTFAIAMQSSLFEQGLTAGRSIDVEVMGPELPKLIDLGIRIMGQARSVVPGAQAFPRPSLDLASPEVHVVPKREKSREMGMTASSLGYTVDALVDGAYAADYVSGGKKIDLTILGLERFASRTHDVAGLPVATPTGDLIPLGALADVTLGSGPEQINHRERQRAITIQVNPPPEMALEAAMDRIRSQIVDPLVASGELAGLYQINLAGTADKLRETWTALRFNVILAMVISYLLMAALFESWLYPIVVMVSVPLAAVGGFAALALMNLFTFQALDVLTMLGFVILIGTAVNNAILIVEQSLVHMRSGGMEMREAVLEAVRIRIRPIFMTTSTTVFGLLPLVLFPGAGSELYRGLGSVMLGGLTVSTVFVLVLVPTLFLLLMQGKAALVDLFARKPRAAVATASAPEMLPAERGSSE